MYPLYPFLILSILSIHSFSLDPVTEYYKNIDTSKRGEEFLSQLHDLIKIKEELSYDDLWDCYHNTDINIDICDADSIYAVYSNKCYKSSQQCGSYHREGDCFNREHSWPKSWWGGFSKGKGAQTDLHSVIPADGYLNGLRSNLPLDTVSTSSPFFSLNFSSESKVGSCSNVPTTSCFEPSDQDKGRLARIYFYLSTCYRHVWDCCDEVAVNKWDIKIEEERVLRSWHKQYPADKFEKRRNDIVFGQYQKNRNPFVDFPDWVDYVDNF